MEEGVMSEQQIALKEYLKACGVPNITGMKIMVGLWDTRATMEMVEFILETREKDPAVLSSVAMEISRKYKVVENLPD